MYGQTDIGGRGRRDGVGARSSESESGERDDAPRGVLANHGYLSGYGVRQQRSSFGVETGNGPLTIRFSLTSVKGS